MIVSLPMYDWPEIRWATDRWWAGLCSHLRAAGFRNLPKEHDRITPLHDQWRSPDLLLTQICGYPLLHQFDGLLELLGTPCYAADGCQGAAYSSNIVVREHSPFWAIEELRGTTAAYNSADSMSGHLALRAAVSSVACEKSFFGRMLESGSHVRSMELIATGIADVAAIDCVSYMLAERYRPDLVQPLRIIARSPLVSGLPYVSAAGRSPAEILRLRQTLSEAIADPRLAEARMALLITGVEMLGREDYLGILSIEAQVEHEQVYRGDNAVSTAVTSSRLTGIDLGPSLCRLEARSSQYSLPRRSSRGPSGLAE
jgi:ABC-type phosphate/phosphonate transport system substrate-binding protein